MKLFFGITAILVLAACATSKVKGDGAGQTIDSKKPERPEKATLGYSFVPGDSLQTTSVDSVYISENTMYLKVHYGGGCETPRFKLEGSKAISKSLPPIRNIVLLHIGKKDLCKALVYKTLQFDISEFAYKKEAGSEIFLNLQGYDGNLKYTYSAN